MYEFSSRVRYSEVDPEWRMTLAALTKRMQDCSVFHSDSIGRGPEVWVAEKVGWVLVSWQILIRKIPVFGESVTTGTWAHRFHAMEGDRNFIVKNEAGELCAEANARFIYFDLAGQRPLRVPEEEMEKFGTEPALDTFVYAPRRMRLPKTEPLVCEPFAIQPMNIDTNHHVNNIAYIEMAVSLLPPESLVREMRVQYLSQARLGDTLVPKCFHEDTGEGKLFTVALEKTGGELCAIVAFLLAPLCPLNPSV